MRRASASSAGTKRPSQRGVLIKSASQRRARQGLFARHVRFQGIPSVGLLNFTAFLIRCAMCTQRYKCMLPCQRRVQERHLADSYKSAPYVGACVLVRTTPF